MDEIIIFEGTDLDTLVRHCREIVEAADAGELRRARFVINQGMGIKLNEGMWTVPLGRVDR